MHALSKRKTFKSAMQEEGEKGNEGNTEKKLKN